LPLLSHQPAAARDKKTVPTEWSAGVRHSHARVHSCTPTHDRQHASRT
jgi:hypothetical protein